MTTLLSFLFVLGILVFVHELGHFLVARWHGVRVITFSLGFGPKILKFTRGGTEYCVSIVPLGGYVKLAGETTEDAPAGAPDEFLSKSKWVRFQVYIAGPIMNILLAIIVLAGVLSQGADVPLYTSQAPVIGDIEADSPAAVAGLRAGDRVVSAGGREVPTWQALAIESLIGTERSLPLQVERNGETVTVTTPPYAPDERTVERGWLPLGVRAVWRPQIVQVNPGTPADTAGVRRGDVIIAINGARALPQEQIIERIRASAGNAVELTVERDGKEMALRPVPEGGAGSAVIGVSISPYETRRVDPSVVDAFKMSAQENWESTLLIGRTLRGLFTADTPMRQLMGPVAIAEMSGTAAQIGWIAIFNLMAMLSLNLGLINLMPVPVLDGGHIAILAVEGLARRDLSIRVKERILMAGAAMIVLLMVTVIYNDIARLLR